jgi:hypothetical protein
MFDRMVLVRLSSLGSLCFALYFTLLDPQDAKSSVCIEEGGINTTSCCANYLWEGDTIATIKVRVIIITAQLIECQPRKQQVHFRFKPLARHFVVSLEGTVGIV